MPKRFSSSGAIRHGHGRLVSLLQGVNVYRLVVFMFLVCAMSLFAQRSFAQSVSFQPFFNCVNPSVSTPDGVDANYSTSCLIDYRITMSWSRLPSSYGPHGGGSAHSPANTSNTTSSANDKNPCAGKVADPVDVSTGYKTEHYVDFSVPVEMGLKYERFYVSSFGVSGAGLGGIGGYWTTNLDYMLANTWCYMSFNGQTCPPITYIRPDGSSLVFNTVTPFGPVPQSGRKLPRQADISEVELLA